MKIVIYYLAGIIILTGGMFFKGDDVFNYFTVMGVVVAVFLIPLVEYLDSNTDSWVEIRNIVKANTIYRKEKIRLSISYLFRIKIDNKYFLVKGNKIKQFQPVGGVYKYYPEAVSTFNKLKVVDDDAFPIEESSRSDLRIRVEGDNLGKFMKWFKSNKEREVCVDREFYEELIENKILNRDIFPYIKTSFVKRVIEDIKNNEYFECREILIADIYEIKLNEQQEIEFRKLMGKVDSGYIWAEASQINSLGAIKGKKNNDSIARTAKWII